MKHCFALIGGTVLLAGVIAALLFRPDRPEAPTVCTQKIAETTFDIPCTVIERISETDSGKVLITNSLDTTGGVVDDAVLQSYRMWIFDRRRSNIGATVFRNLGVTSEDLLQLRTQPTDESGAHILERRDSDFGTTYRIHFWDVEYGWRASTLLDSNFRPVASIADPKAEISLEMAFSGDFDNESSGYFMSCDRLIDAWERQPQSPSVMPSFEDRGAKRQGGCVVDLPIGDVTAQVVFSSRSVPDFRRIIEFSRSALGQWQHAAKAAPPQFPRRWAP